jgi:hypothetical protein
MVDVVRLKLGSPLGSPNGEFLATGQLPAHQDIRQCARTGSVAIDSHPVC